MSKLVVTSHNLKSLALKNLAIELGNQLGYKVFRVKPDCVRGRHAVVFHGGIDKVTQFRKYHENQVAAPQYVTHLGDVNTLPSKQVVIRRLIDSSEGRGINIVNKEDCTERAPLYTEYIPKKTEYRVHVWDGKVIDVQEKRRRRGGDGEKEYQVRNTANGYVFCRADVAPPDDCRSVALSAVLSLGRAYGAADIIYNEKRDKCYVLEVNSRPGMQGTTVKKYADAIVSTLPQDVLHPPRKLVRPKIRRQHPVATHRRVLARGVWGR